MADTKISALAALTGANSASGDKIPIVDVSEAADADKNKSITRNELLLTINATTEVTDPLDDDMVSMVDDPAGTPVPGKVKKRRLYWGGAAVPYFTDTGLYLSHPTATVGSATAVTANRLYIHPVIVPFRRAITAIACFSTAAVGNVRMGIYNSVFSSSGWAPGTLNTESASTAVVNAAITTAAISVTLDEGVYYLASVFDGVATMRQFGQGAGNILGLDLAAGPNLSPAGLYSAHTYGALPNLTGVGQTKANAFCVGIR